MNKNDLNDFDFYNNYAYTYCARHLEEDGFSKQEWGQAAELYEKKIKAFEIIKKKQVNVYNFVWYHEHHKWMNYEEYCKILDLPEEEGCDDTFQLQEFCKCGERLTQEEYDLLKEVLL